MTHNTGDLLRQLSKKLIQLSGNDMINKRLSGKGTGGIFNVCDEIPQFVLNRLMEGKKFKIVPMKESQDYLQDENSSKFKEDFALYLEKEGLWEDSLEDDEIREHKDQLRIELGMTPADELIPAGHQLELPLTSANQAEIQRHTDDKLQTDLSEENLKKCLTKIERERVRFEREKGLQTLYIAFGFLKWQNADNKNFTSPVLLMRVSLERARAANAYKLLASGDLETNQSLSYALYQETREQPPKADQFVDENGVFDLNAFFEAFSKYIEKYDDWKMLNRISVGIFKSRGIPFSEILPEGYSKERIEAAEEILTGRYEFPSNAGPRDVDSKDSRDLVPAFALKADSSQHAAILDVAEGKNLVIEGPPGTGKSQTIVNLIANSLYQGKKVLFLAQKLAALEVVNNRLEKVGLGKKCISLHSEYASRSLLFKSIGEKIDKPDPRDVVTFEQFDRVKTDRDQILTKLNDHAHMMSKAVFDGSDPGIAEKDTLIAHRALTTFPLLRHITENEKIPDFQIVPNYDLRQLGKDLDDASRLEELVGAVQPEYLLLLERFKHAKSVTPFEIEDIYREMDDLNHALADFPETYLEIDLEGMRKFANDLAITRSVKVKFEECEAKLATMLSRRPRPTHGEANTHLKELGDHASLGIILKSSLIPWSGCSRAKKFFRETLDLQKASLADLQRNARELVTVLRDLEKSRLRLKEAGYLETTSEEISKQIQWLKNRAGDLDQASVFASKISLTVGKISAKELREQFTDLIVANGSFGDLCTINKTLEDFDHRIRCGSWLRQLILDSKSLRDRLEASLYEFFSKKVSNSTPAIFDMKRKDMDDLREKFKKAETECRETYVGQTVTRMPKKSDLPQHPQARRVGEMQGGQLLNHISKVPNARVTVREVSIKAIDTLMHYTPCFLMTPSSVADYVPKKTQFDLVIIDEASQMLPEEAIGSILRSKQVVVVGDPMQMPPTRYMQSTLDDEIDEDDDTKYSILDKALLSFPNFRRLCYHYRSEDESLIRFSNNEFYDNDLMIIPNLRHDESLGVKFVDAKGVYNSGKADLVMVDEHGQTAGWSPSKNPNRIEAEKTVEIILNEIRERPNSSIGVAVMNLKQAIRIDEIFQDKVDDRIRDYLKHWKKTPEYFFIKNLENVQGDERDTIIIATVYGKNHDGKMKQLFGPINTEKGENRINVLVTRAKRRVVVCSSMNPNDIDLPSRGPQVLRRYLQYAKTGQLEDPSTINTPGGDHWYDSPWEKWFHDRLERDGYIVNPQVGVSEWRIDLGVMHKDYPEGYLCGIELDGKDHLRQSARDRDIERQAILESKGWIILRVWSIDFFSDQEGEYQILKSAIDEILQEKRNAQFTVQEEGFEGFDEHDDQEETEEVYVDLLEY